MSIHAEARNNNLEFLGVFLMFLSTHVRKVFLQKRHRNSFTWILTNSLSSEFPMTVNIDSMPVSSLWKKLPQWWFSRRWKGGVMMQ